MATKLTVKVNLTSTTRAAGDTPAPPPVTASPSDFQASLAALRAAEEASRLRARRESRRARAVVAGVIGLCAAGTWGVSLRVRPADGAATRPHRPVAMHVAAPLATLAAAPKIASHVATPPSYTEPAPAAIVVPVAPAALTCQDDFASGRWRLAAESCAAAFEQRNEAGLASKAAHALHRRARFAEAGAWAQRALALDPARAEALVIVAHADARAGRAAEAARAYRRYLRLAPNGWHASEARRALAMDDPAP